MESFQWILRNSLISIFLGLLLPNMACAMDLLVDAPYKVCFTPGQNCTQLIVDKINAANQSIYLQAYSFSSQPIVDALLDAKNRGVVIQVILDKSQISAKYSAVKLLIDEGIEPYIDFKPAIAHNKVIIIDEQEIITGSFNFTQAAQQHNAENLIIIDDVKLAKQYLGNWYNRLKFSVLASDYQSSNHS